MVEARPSVLCPVTLRVPLDVSEEVAVILPIVAVPPRRDEIVPVTVLKSEVKRLVVVALVNTGLSESV